MRGIEPVNDMPHKRDLQMGTIRVTGTMLSTPRQLFVLNDIDHVTYRRPLLPIALPVASVVAGLVWRFSAFLYGTEMIVLSAIGLGAIAVSSQVAALSLHSLSLRDASIWGPHWHLKRVRDAVRDVLSNNTQVKSEMGSEFQPESGRGETP